MKTPQVLRLEKLANLHISEERGWWVKAHTTDDPRVFIELSFDSWQEMWPARHRVFPHPTVPITYIGLFCGKTTWAEFQLGSWFRIPIHDEAKLLLSQILSLLVDVKPMFFAPRVDVEEVLNVYRSVASSSSRTTRYL